MPRVTKVQLLARILYDDGEVATIATSAAIVPPVDNETGDIVAAVQSNAGAIMTIVAEQGADGVYDEAINSTTEHREAAAAQAALLEERLQQEKEEN